MPRLRRIVRRLTSSPKTASPNVPTHPCSSNLMSLHTIETHFDSFISRRFTRHRAFDASNQIQLVSLQAGGQFSPVKRRLVLRRMLQQSSVEVVLECHGRSLLFRWSDLSSVKFLSPIRPHRLEHFCRAGYLSLFRDSSGSQGSMRRI